MKTNRQKVCGWMWLAFGVLICVAVFLFAENEIAPQFRQCVGSWPSEFDPYQSDDDRPIVPSFIRAQGICTISLIDRHNGFFALLGTIAVAAFTFTLWRSTEKLWKADLDKRNDFERSIKAAEKSADAALNSISSQSVAQRAYMIATPPNIKIIDENIVIRATWKNCGVTPATYVRAQSVFANIVLPFSEDFDFYQGKVHDGFDRLFTDAGPGETVFCSAFPISIESYFLICNSGKSGLFVASWIEYFDIFTDERHRSESCFRILPIPLVADRANYQIEVIGRHNGSDQTCQYNPFTYPARVVQQRATPGTSEPVNTNA